MNKALGYKKGKTYLCSYWGEKHKVIDIRKGYNYLPIIVSKWEDGRITKHSTARKPKDKEL